MYAEPWEPKKGELLFDRYDIIKKLGEGAWGTVYLAYDMRWKVKGPVAIKHLRPEIVQSNPRAIERFKRELKIIMKNLRGLPQVVNVYDFNNMDENNYFYIMDYVGGGSLRDLLYKQSIFPILDAIDMALDICGALEAIHRRDVIHNDLKPDNILMPEQRTERLVMISDFGSASLVGSRGGLSTGMTGPRTLYYSSPELLKEEPVDKRSDLYAVGVMLYEMIVGEVPFFYEEGADLVSRILNDPPTVPSSRRRSVSSALDGVILKVLEKYPGERYSSASEMMSALRKVRTVEAQRHEKKQEFYKRGVSHLDTETWQAAIECFDKVKALDPNYKNVVQLLEKARRQGNLEVRYARAKASIKSAEWETAVIELEEIFRIEEDYRDAKALLEKAKTQHRLAELYEEAMRCEQGGEWATAKDRYLQIVSIDSAYRDVLDKVAEAAKRIKLGDMQREVDEYLLEGELERAIRILEEILRKEPEDREAMERLQEVRRQKEMWTFYTEGMRYLYDKRWDLAMECFEEVAYCVPASFDEDVSRTALDPLLEEALSNMPTYVLASVRLVQAKKLKISIALNEGKRCLGNGRFREAIDNFDEVLSLCRGHREALQKREESEQHLKQQMEKPSKPVGPGMSLSLTPLEKFVLTAVVVALVAGLSVVVAANIAQVDVSQPVWVVLGISIALIGLVGFLALRFSKGRTDQ
jgi:serine/threonine protein kinase